MTYLKLNLFILNFNNLIKKYFVVFLKILRTNYTKSKNEFS